MSSLQDLKKNLPPETQVVFDAFWDALPLPDQKNFLELIQAFPSETNLLQLLFKMGSKQLKMTFGNKTSIAIVGPANVGKSTLYNRFISQKEDRAEVSPLPGTTRAVQEADAGIFTVVDTPGADAVGDVGEKERISALDAAAKADFLIIVFDAIQGIKITELDLYERLKRFNKPYLVVLNKCDLVKKDLKDIVAYSSKTLDLSADQILPVSAKTGDHISDLLRMIAVTEPSIVSALGQALPQYRWQMAWRSIASAASVSAAIALTPLPIIDFLPLVVTQSVMVLGIARIYNYKITPARARELVVSFGLGFLGRTLFYELSKFGGLPGWLLAAAVSVSTTVVMGYAAVMWFERGERLTNESIRQLSKNLTQTFLENMKSLIQKKPGQKGIKKVVEEMLNQSPLADDRSLMDDQAAEILLENGSTTSGNPETKEY